MHLFMKPSLNPKKSPFNFMRNLITQIFLLVCIVNSSVTLPPTNHTKWNILTNEKIWVGWTEFGDIQWSQARSTISASKQKIEAIIKDKPNYPNVFKRVESAQIITDEIVHISLDMPFPFSNRDYVVSYSQNHDGEDIIYRFHAVNHPDAQLSEGYVRLVNAAGEWRLHPLAINSTEVSYTWNGELRGDFPDWALTRAWETQGEEVMGWLREPLQK